MLEDSSPEKWEYKEHTRVKHILLDKYLAAWIPILGRRGKSICYFDGFAGRGEYEDGTLGSPLIAMKVADEKANYFGKLLCVFIEKDKNNYKNLCQVLKSEKTNIRNWNKIDIMKENNEFTNVIEGIFNYLENKKNILAPSFFFVDPFGFSGIPFDIVRRILQNPSTEVFFTFMVRDISRFIKKPRLRDTFTKLFGTEEWKVLLQLPGREKALIELYRKQLHEVARVKYSLCFRVSESDKLKTLYYLIHSTNNFKGHSIMKSIMFNQSAQGSFAYLGPKDISERTQTRLFDILNIEQLKKYLLEKFKDVTLTYDGIQKEVCIPWYSEPPYIDKHYRQALKELEKEHKIKVERVTSKTGKGLSGNDRITFPKVNPIQAKLSNTIRMKTKIPKIYKKSYKMLNGRKKILVERVNDGSIIKRFDKTPYPEKPTDVVCPHFLELKWAYGCPFDCSWCYLKGTFRFRPEGIKPAFKPIEKVKLHTEAFIDQVDTPEILNTGEIADSLMKEGKNSSFSKFIIPMFESQSKHKVLFVTKSTSIKNLLDVSSKKQVIMSFSLNAETVATKWERRAPSVNRRLEAARKLEEASYEVRIRIDPIVPIENWQEHYLHLLDEIFSSFKPTRITLGSLRGLQSTINGTKDRSWVHFLKESSNWGKKIDFTTRLKIYKIMLEYLRNNLRYTDVALCKETVAMWEKLKLNWHKIKCNCVW